jgi:polysaccharide export outer membrane protein
MAFFCSCRVNKSVSRDYLYFQDADSIGSYNVVLKEYTINPGDILSIGLATASMNQEQLIPFAKGAAGIDEIGSKYAVDAEGFITYPFVGKLKVLGSTRTEIEKNLESKLIAYISRPSVSVTVVNFRVTVLGEVRQPGSYPMPDVNTTLLDALGAAGDLTPFANRKKLVIIRKKQDGVTEFHNVDLTKASTSIGTPVFQLAQRDVVYVPTIESKINTLHIDESKLRSYSLIISSLSVLGLLLNVAFNRF